MTTPYTTVYNVEGNYGYGQGFEIVTFEKTRAEALKRLREYRENDPGVPVRIKRARVYDFDAECRKAGNTIDRG